MNLILSDKIEIEKRLFERAENTDEIKDQHTII